ncbi:hypothetical protein RirG_124450 [Rhizophagus irregularis DAOM 197198w]|uniref:NADH-ubiquinone oxidoreductase n=1 Tax=Rhizophagus irregularis (strain DAOM 197198w) TaxID=1432141 RepID=A0A015L1X1_RHIIW|nr:hypothetical protein RirG_124450 [Rhizophagus irregularis DAOM 197198w]
MTTNATDRHPFLSNVPFKDETPLPDDIPKVEEVGATSAPLKSASFFIGAYCKDFNDDFMLCKNENNDPKHCLKEDRSNQEYHQCRPQERTFNTCVFNALNLEKIIPGTPQGKPPIHLKEKPVFK